MDKAGHPTSENCGCSITGEEKRKKLANGEIKKFYYWHCTSIRACSQRNVEYLAKQQHKKANYSQMEIEALMEVVFRPLSFTPEICKWMQEVLLKEHEGKSAAHYHHLGALRRRYELLQKYIDRAFEDKLNGVIEESYWREKNQIWRLELESVQKEIDAINDIKQDYIHRGVELIELVQHFETLYKNANSEKKRKWVEIVSSNHVLKDGSIEFSYRKPFDILASATPKDNWWT